MLQGFGFSFFVEGGLGFRVSGFRGSGFRAQGPRFRGSRFRV